jgi:hypothetical protein
MPKRARKEHARPRFLIPVAILSIVLLAASLVVVARVTSTSIDGIGCDFSEGATYHVHAHLTLVVRRRAVHPPGGIGFRYLHLCLYWLHTHDGSGIIHIEAPHKFAPTLRNFFDIWGQPISRKTVWKYSVTSGLVMRVFVDGRPFGGDPSKIRLHNHTAVTIEVGPPFIPPPPPDFQGF